MNRKANILIAALMLLVIGAMGFATAPGTLQAQDVSRTFPETGKTVKGKFLTYWDTHGGLPQQGFPISDEMQEVSPTDGRTYTVQYFERAVFELHPENQPPNDVLLSLLGVFLYNQKYTTAGAPNQVPNNEAGSQLFPETGKRVGGRFLAYWRNNGGLAQQGFPISDEFNEVSELDGKTYKVQYFQRAVFEYHPEQTDPRFQVLLSQLGTFRYRQVYLRPSPTATVPVANTPVPQPTTAPPPPQATPTSPAANPCAGVPASTNMLIVVLDSTGSRVLRESNCERAGVLFGFLGGGFEPGENIGVYITAPDQSVFGAPFQTVADEDGISGGVTFQTRPGFPPGIWAITMEGTTTHRTAIGYFRILP